MLFVDDATDFLMPENVVFQTHPLRHIPMLNPSKAPVSSTVEPTSNGEDYPNRPPRGTFIRYSGSGDCGGQVLGEACWCLVVEGPVGPRGVVVGDPGCEQIAGTRAAL